MAHSNSNDQSILLEVLKTANEAGAGGIEMEYKSGEETVFAFKGNMGIGIASFDSRSPEAEELRDDLCQRERKKSQVTIDGIKYTLKVQTYDSFGETHFASASGKLRCGICPFLRLRGEK
jgi:hypothetical protein